MCRLWAQPLRRQLFIAIALLLLPVLAAAAWSGWSTLKERESDLASLDRMAGNIALNPYVLALGAPQSLTLLTGLAANRRSILDVPESVKPDLRLIQKESARACAIICNLAMFARHPRISPENEARLFQPFFTTKPVGQGTGLGLSVSYGIIDSLGGKIGFRSAPTGSAVFHFELPAVAPGAA